MSLGNTNDRFRSQNIVWETFRHFLIFPISYTLIILVCIDWFSVSLWSWSHGCFPFDLSQTSDFWFWLFELKAQSLLVVCVSGQQKLHLGVRQGQIVLWRAEVNRCCHWGPPLAHHICPPALPTVAGLLLLPAPLIPADCGVPGWRWTSVTALSSEGCHLILPEIIWLKRICTCCFVLWFPPGGE